MSVMNTNVSSEENIAQTPINVPSEANTSAVDTDPGTLSNESRTNRSTVQVRSGDNIMYLPHDESEWRKATVMSRAGKATGKYKNWFNIKDIDTETCRV
jgi:hypothetical protein